MKHFSPYRLLEIPWVYSLAQVILAPGAESLLKKKFEKIFSVSEGLVLDVGCGPRLNTPLPRGHIVGVDINQDYVKKYTAKGQGQIMGLVCSADLLAFNNDTFDECRNFGLLHHLPRQEAIKTAQEMFRCVRPGGRVVIIDTPWPKRTFLRPLAWLINRLDRGKWIRTAEEWQEIVRCAYPGNWSTERFTYTYTGIEALVMQTRKDHG